MGSKKSKHKVKPETRRVEPAKPNQTKPEAKEEPGQDSNLYKYLKSNSGLEHYKILLEQAYLNSHNACEPATKKTLLHLAVENNDSKTSKMILDEDPSLLHVLDAQLENFVFAGVRRSKLEVLRYICGYLKSSNNDVASIFDQQTPSNGLTPIMVAAWRGERDIVKFLLREVLVDPTKRDHEGWAAIHFAAENNQSEVIKILLTGQKDNIEARTSKGETPLIIASQNKSVEAFTVLINEGSNIESVQADGWSSAHYGARENSVLILEALFRHSQSTQGIFHQKTKMGSTPLICASTTGAIEAASWLLSKGVPVDCGTLNNCTALHYAVANGHLKIIEHLHRAGCHGNIKTNGGLTVMHLAVQHGHENIAKYLLEKVGVLPNVRDVVRGWAPLHYAVDGGNLALVKLLVENGGLVNQIARDNMTTPLTLSRDQNKKEIMEYLRDNMHVDIEDTWPEQRFMSHKELVCIVRDRGTEKLNGFKT